jgi:hypothetical protein
LHVQGEVWAMERKKHVKRDRKKKEIKREDWKKKGKLI